MEDRRPSVMPSRLGFHRVASALLLGSALISVPSGYAQPLNQRIPQLFGGALLTSINPNVADRAPDVQQVRLAERFRGLSAALAAARSQAPIPSATGALRFEWNDDLDLFVRTPQSLGPLLAERAQTLGRQTATISVSYTHIDFDTLEGDRLDRLRSSQPALSAGFLDQLPSVDRQRGADNILQTDLNLAFSLDLLFFTAAVGLTDSVDVSLAVAVNHAHMRGVADATILDPHNDGGAFFVKNQKGVIVGGSGPVCGIDFRCAKDEFDDSAFGTGDIFLRGKWHLYDSTFADLAMVGVLTVPTGNADDFLGFHDPTFTPWLIASKSFGRVSPHVNVGYAFRSGADVSQAEWIAGADVLAANWLTLNADFLGFHDDKRDGINDNVLQSAIGFKLNPFDRIVFAGGFQFPLNRDGLRADVIYTGQAEYTF